MADRDYSQVDDMLMRREEAKHERLKQKAEAAQENMQETLAALLKQLAVKKALAPDVLQALEDEDGQRLRKLRDKAENWGSKDREVPTGIGDGHTRVDSFSSVDYQS